LIEGKDVKQNILENKNSKVSDIINPKQIQFIERIVNIYENDLRVW